MWADNLEDFIWQMHGVSVVWKPSFDDDEPPF
jgi:hypothetical protein